MPLSVVDLYRDILPKTNCRDCGHPTCLAFASMVVSARLDIAVCPHLSPEVVARCREALEQQYADKKWTKRDLAEDALAWAKERAASMAVADLPPRIGGELVTEGSAVRLRLPYFKGHILIGADGITTASGAALDRWEQVFILNHMAQGGSARPTGVWKGLQEFPNTVSKIKSMQSHVEAPLIERFGGRTPDLVAAARTIGGADARDRAPSADVAILFQPLPRIPIMLLFWDRDGSFGAQARLLFDETIVTHLDIESILFLSERLARLLIGDGDSDGS